LLLRRAIIAVTVFFLFCALRVPAAAAPEGTLTWGLHVTLAARWLDPSDTEAFINPFMVLYAVHDALVKPAESWTVSKDGLASTTGTR
jgi:peptide/nickel transport system substrate-binding protein